MARSSLCWPLDFRNEARRIAPDLWHIRVWSGELRPQLPVPQAALSAAATGDAPQASLPTLAHVPESDPAVQAWKALLASAGSSPERINLNVGFDAYERLVEAGKLQQAREIARELLVLARQRSGVVPGDKPTLRDRITRLFRPPARTNPGDTATLRDLSVSLDNVGDVDQALGQYEAARAAYAESLALRRKINAAVGETPQGLIPGAI